MGPIHTSSRESKRPAAASKPSRGARAAPPGPTFFTSARAFHKWLARHHDRSTELWVGFFKKSSGRRSITYPEALDEALCFGWIDGLRKGIDELSYRIRFTPRKPTSIWSAVNTKRVGELEAAGRMQPSGLETFRGRDHERTKLYSYERSAARLDEAQERKLKANRPAWAFFQAQPPFYRRTATWWVVSAKKDETRVRRLDVLIETSAKGLRLPQFTSPARKPGKSRQV
jgi:uncharacterized protein YdeI (YjbR/CyaY-like superfamily)